jgi:MFS transporter, PAT family, beta-lactamase induction signal transducer AmpG
VRRVKTLVESRLTRFVVLAALYFAQGIPWGFVSVGYVVFLADNGADNTAVGNAIALAYVPWSFKFLAGPVIDRFPSLRFGRRRPYIVVAEFLMGAMLLLLLAIDPGKDLGWVGVILFAHNTFAAIQDVATDALAIDVLPLDERGKANSFTWAAKSAGVVVGGGGGTVFAKYLGWPALFVAIAVLIWLVMVLVILVPERPRPRLTAPTYRGNLDLGPPPIELKRLNLKEIVRSFTFRAPLIGIAIASLTPVGYALIQPVFTRLLRADLKLGEGPIALLSGTIDPVSSVVGALIGGVLADRFGPRRVMAGGMVIMATALFTFGAAQSLWPSFGFLSAYTIALKSAESAFSAAFFSLAMTLSNPAIGATQFALYMATTNLTYSWASALGGRIADAWGVAPAFLVAAVIQLVTIGLLPLCDPRSAEIRFRGETA